MPDKLRVRLRKSPISYTAKARGTVRALGLHRMHETVEVPDNPATRGMVRAIRFLVEVEEVPAEHPAGSARQVRGRATARATATASATPPAASEAGPADESATAAAPAGATEGPGPEEERA
jgi:large subunit ribosomal protein L30